jgi:hypothetical protein
MARGRRRDEWERWASWMTMYAECHRDTKKRRAAYTPSDFLPEDLRPKRAKSEPIKMTIKQYAAALGQPINGQAVVQRGG